MPNEYKTIKCKLDGKQSVSIPIDIKKNGRYVTDPLDVIVRGFLKFKDTQVNNEPDPNTLVDKTVVYPVLFTSDTIRINDGRCVVTIIPRSEDLFEDTASVVESASITDEDITSGGIREDEQITDPQKNPVVIKIETGVIREPYRLSIEITVVSVGNTDFYVQTVDRGTNPQIETTDSVTSLFQKKKSRIPSNIIIDCYNDLEWVPSVSDILGDNNATKDQVLDSLGDLENSTPFGMSTMYDAVVASARILSDGTIDDKKKTIYVFTDNEANISKASIDNALEEVNDIDGDKRVPVLISNMAVVDPATLSVKANSSDTKNINKLSFLTGGQALTIIDENYLDDIVGIFYREAVGSMGYGTYEFIADMGNEVLVNQITGFFDIPTSDSNATWSIETSLDGYNFTLIDDSYSYSENAEFENLHARYMRFKVILITAINSIADEYGAYPETPALLSIRIFYNSYKIAYLYLNKVDTDIQSYQITMAVDANEVNDDQIKVGIAKSDAHNWEDFYTESQPTVDQNGKIVIPLRFSQDTAEFSQEPLKKIDTFTLKTEYGRFDAFSNVIIYDKNDEILSTDYYKLQNRDGLVIFNYALPTDYVDGDYKIGIINGDEYKVGIKMTNKTNDTGLEMYGVGYVYTTGKNLLPPLAKAAPEAQAVEIPGEVFDRFSIMEATYVYYDSNFEPEDLSQRTVKWLINGAPISYLDNVMKWNDINNPADPLYLNTSLTYPDELEEGETLENWAKKQNDSILHSTNNVYFEIRVSDGIQNSNRVKSNVAEIGDSSPVLGRINIMGSYGDEITSRLSADARAVIYPSIEDVFYSDGGANKSEIIWYVNGDIFKRGIYGTPSPDGVAPIHEIWPGEDGTTGEYRDYALKIANVLIVEVIPKTGDQVGESVLSKGAVVVNSFPEVGNVQYLGSDVHDDAHNLHLAWSFFDFEIMFLSDIDETNQYDQTEIRWHRKNAGENVWPDNPIYTYNNHDANLDITYGTDDDRDTYGGHITTTLVVGENSLKSSIVDSGVVRIGQQWYAEILPHDFLDFGDTFTTKVITVVAQGSGGGGGGTYTLNITISPGESSGSVSPPGGAGFIKGQSYTLTATPVTGYFFGGWSGDLTGFENPITFAWNEDRDMNVTATFVGGFMG